MLAEFQNVRQIPKEGYRRWFADNNFDLIVWYDDESRLTGFQLCYDKTSHERALTWTAAHGFQHNRIDAGETPGHIKMTPVIVADGEFNAGPIAELFQQESSAIDPAVSRFVYSALRGYPRRPDAGASGS